MMTDFEETYHQFIQHMICGYVEVAVCSCIYVPLCYVIKLCSYNVYICTCVYCPYTVKNEELFLSSLWLSKLHIKNGVFHFISLACSVSMMHCHFLC